MTGLKVGERLYTIQAEENNSTVCILLSTNLRAIISTFLSLLTTDTSSRLEPQQLSFLTLDMSDTRVRAWIISSVSFTMLCGSVVGSTLVCWRLLGSEVTRCRVEFSTYTKLGAALIIGSQQRRKYSDIINKHQHQHLTWN